ncbi:MAG: helix-turn-helix domain-containing protein [Fibromonadales bacterium]|nr:helix-turn-helix domain-containing protein [Fibromonadales bacterium]
MATENESEFSIGDNEKVGDYLRRVREARGVELEHLAKAIRLSKNILESIEANRWSDFPTEAYLRSYIISLCEKLLIDKHVVISKFSLEINSHFAISQANMMSDQNQESSAPVGNNSKIAIIIVVAIAAILFFSKQMLDSSSEAESVVPEPLQLAEPQAAVDGDGQSEAADSALAAALQPEVNLDAKDTIRLECVHTATDNTCGVSVKGFDTKMSYFTRAASRYINHHDTVYLTITVPPRTRLFINNNKVEYGRFNTLYLYQGQIIDKSNRELR